MGNRNSGRFEMMNPSVKKNQNKKAKQTTNKKQRPVTVFIQNQIKCQ